MGLYPLWGIVTFLIIRFIKNIQIRDIVHSIIFLNMGNYYFEVQVRTIAEEVYAEFDHYVKYPYRENNHFLKRYNMLWQNC